MTTIATKSLVVLGAGTAGTMVANKLRRRLTGSEWEITVVDRDDVHHYQPGYLFLPFGDVRPRAGRRRSRHALLPRRRRPRRSARSTGSTPDGERRAPRRTAGRWPTTTSSSPPAPRPRPDQTPGHARARVAAQHLRLLHPRGRRGACRGARRLRPAAGSSCTSPRCRSSARWRPLEFTFLADAWLRERGLRDRVELVYVTPLDGAFTKPVASAHLGGMLEERKIAVETDFMVERIDAERKCWSPTTSARSPSTCW